jgi:hypothetical protein
VLFDYEKAQLEVRAPAVGLLATGVVTLVCWALACVLMWSALRHWQVIHPGDVPPSEPILGLAAAAVIGVLSCVLMAGAVQMLRLRSYPLAATAAIVAMIPWSPGWLLGLPFGIWACHVLGRPQVTEAFFDDKRPAGSGPPGARQPGARVAGRVLSLLRSMGRYFLTTRLGHRTVAPHPPGASPSAVPSPLLRPSGNDPGEAR